MNDESGYGAADRRPFRKRRRQMNSENGTTMVPRWNPDSGMLTVNLIGDGNVCMMQSCAKVSDFDAVDLAACIVSWMPDERVRQFVSSVGTDRIRSFIDMCEGDRSSPYRFAEPLDDGLYLTQSGFSAVRSDGMWHADRWADHMNRRSMSWSDIVTELDASEFPFIKVRG